MLVKRASRIGMQAAMERQDEATRQFVGPWWLAVALLEVQAQEVIEPVLRHLPAVTLGRMTRGGTEGHLAMHWGAGSVSFPTMTGELRIEEVDGNCTQLTLTGDFAPPLSGQGALDDVTERLARRIEAAVAREIGTP
jgi:hypothetical protein